MIVEILRHTPLWVFFLFAGLVALGVRRLRTGDVSVRQLFALPIAMTVLSAFGVWQATGASVVSGIAWLVALALMLVAGAVLPTGGSVEYSPTSRRIRVPGSALPLVLMMTIFFLRYAVSVELAMHPSLRFEMPFVVAVGAAYGLSSGCFAARALRIWRSAFQRDVRSSNAIAA